MHADLLVVHEGAAVVRVGQGGVWDSVVVLREDRSPLYKEGALERGERGVAREEVVAVSGEALARRDGDGAARGDQLDLSASLPVTSERVLDVSTRT